MTLNRRVTWQATSDDENSWPRSAVRRRRGRSRRTRSSRPPKICWRTRPRPESIGSSGKIQASRGRGLVAVTGRQGRSASLPAAARDVHVPVRPARRRTGAGRPRRGELAAALRALVFGPPALLAAAAGADRPDRPHAQDRHDFARRNGYFVHLNPRTGIILQV